MRCIEDLEKMCYWRVMQWFKTILFLYYEKREICTKEYFQSSRYLAGRLDDSKDLYLTLKESLGDHWETYHHLGLIAFHQNDIENVKNDIRHERGNGILSKSSSTTSQSRNKHILGHVSLEERRAKRVLAVKSSNGMVPFLLSFEKGNPFTIVIW